MHAPALTVIVTCYNLAPFLPACLQSIFRQSRASSVRVLIIDDGSVDDTREVAQAQMAAHPHVDCQLVTQSNQGVSGARNTGIRLTTTPYLTFLDGDDYWAENYLDRVMPIIEEGRADIIAFNARFVDMTGRTLYSLKSHTRFTDHTKLSSSELAADAASVGEWHTYTRIVRTRLLDGAVFPPGRCYEDAAVMPRLYAKASHIHTIDEELYTYVRRPGSLTSTVSDKHIDDLLSNAREAQSSCDAAADFWVAVHRRTMLQVASEIGRAPRARRRSMFNRAWPQVRAHLDIRSRLRWLFRLLEACLRAEAKRALGRDTNRVEVNARSAGLEGRAKPQP